MVKVVNENKHPYKEKFKGQEIVIPPGKWVEMTKEDAIMFLGTYNGITLNVDGQPDPSCYKKLKIVEGEETKEKK